MHILQNLSKLPVLSISLVAYCLILLMTLSLQGQNLKPLHQVCGKQGKMHNHWTIACTHAYNYAHYGLKNKFTIAKNDCPW